MAITKYVPILGTWAFHEYTATPSWWQPESPFAQMLARRDFRQAEPDDPFVWSGDLDGVPLIGRGQDWEAGAVNLAHYLRDLPLDDRNVIAHSHGGAVALFAARHVPIRRLLTIGTPARKDVRAAAEKAHAAGHLDTWLHVHDKTWDWMGSLGALFDGEFRMARSMKLPWMTDRALQRIGHSHLLSGTAKADDWWDQYGLYSFFI